VNTLKEIRGYQRKKDRQGNVLEEPIKANDHTMDSIRYGLYSYKRMVGKQEPVLEYYSPVVISPY
jgi:phage terminase large subunit